MSEVTIGTTPLDALIAETVGGDGATSDGFTREELQARLKCGATKAKQYIRDWLLAGRIRPVGHRLMQDVMGRPWRCTAYDVVTADGKRPKRA